MNKYQKLYFVNEKYPLHNLTIYSSVSHRTLKIVSLNVLQQTLVYMKLSSHHFNIWKKRFSLLVNITISDQLQHKHTTRGGQGGHSGLDNCIYQSQNDPVCHMSAIKISHEKSKIKKCHYTFRKICRFQVQFRRVNLRKMFSKFTMIIFIEISIYTYTLNIHNICTYTHARAHTSHIKHNTYT